MRIREILSPTHALHLALGLTVWALWFVVIYGGMSLACRFAPPPPALGALTWVNGSVALLTLVTVSLLLWAAWACWRARHTDREPTGARRFIARVSAGLYVASALATLAVGAPSIRLPPCL